MSKSIWTRPYRAFSSFVDDMVLHGTVIFEQRRGFSKTGFDEPPSPEQLIADFQNHRADIRWPTSGRMTRRCRVPVTLPMFDFPSYLDFRPSRNPEADTLVVYHHGLGEIPHQMVPWSLSVWPSLRERCDFIALKGLYHRDFKEVSSHLLGHCHTFVRSLVSSASVACAVAQRQRRHYKHLVMCGMSMGGLITLVESFMEPSFDVYVPFVAGPNLPDVLLYSGFRRIIKNSFRRRARRAHWLSYFDMTPHLQHSEGPPIRPLLAHSDRLFRLQPQLDAYATIERAEVTVVEGGHITLASNIPVIGRYLTSVVDAHCWSRPKANSLIMSS